MIVYRLTDIYLVTSLACNGIIKQSRSALINSDYHSINLIDDVIFMSLHRKTQSSTNLVVE
jgi:hypothetical protein